jgi:peptidyl-tRNA hydrolase
MSNLKMYCIVSREALAKMNGNRGKFGTQAGHAYLHAWWDAAVRFPEAATQYQESGLAFKITLVVDTDEELRELEDVYRDQCGVSLVTDAARTVFTEPTLTCLGIGPIDPDMREDKLKSLKPLI